MLLAQVTGLIHMQMYCRLTKLILTTWNYYTKGEGGAWGTEALPDFKLMLHVYKHLPQKYVEEKQLSGYIISVTHTNMKA